jgi:hypothetical protein
MRGPREHKKGRRQTENRIGHRLARSSPLSSSLAFSTRWAFLPLFTILITLAEHTCTDATGREKQTDVAFG